MKAQVAHMSATREAAVFGDMYTVYMSLQGTEENIHVTVMLGGDAVPLNTPRFFLTIVSRRPQAITSRVR